MYRYFVSYSHMGTEEINIGGNGCIAIERNSKIETYEDILSVIDCIENTSVKPRNVVILFYTIMNGE